MLKPTRTAASATMGGDEEYSYDYVSPAGTEKQDGTGISQEQFVDRRH